MYFLIKKIIGNKIIIIINIFFIVFVYFVVHFKYFNSTISTQDYQKNLENFQWVTSRKDLTSSRYVESNELNPVNINRLELLWSKHLTGHEFQVQASALFFNGFIITPTADNKIIALDVETGDIIWEKSSKYGRLAHRGLIIYDFGAGPKIYAPDGKYIACIEIADGNSCKTFGADGFVKLNDNMLVDPIPYKDSLFLLTSGNEIIKINPINGSILDVITELKNEISPKLGISVWGGVSFDNDNGDIFLSFSNPKPGFDGSNRVGPNIPANSILSFNLNQRKINFIFQEIEHDIWDLDIAAPPLIHKYKINDENHFDLIACSKSGNVIILDGHTGKSRFPIGYVKTLNSMRENEFLPTMQKVFSIPKPQAKMEFTIDDISNLNDQSYIYIKKIIDNSNIGNFVPHDEKRPSIYFGIHGGCEWPGSAIDKKENILVVIANRIPWKMKFKKIDYPNYEINHPARDIFNENCIKCHSNNENSVGPSLLGINKKFSPLDLKEILKYGKGSMPIIKDAVDHSEQLYDFLLKASSDVKLSSGIDLVKWEQLIDEEGYPGSKPPWAIISAIDIVSGKTKWSAPFGEYDELTKIGIPKTGTEAFAGPSITSGGLVFVTGARDKKLYVYDIKNGNELWSFKMKHTGAAAPTIFQWRNRAYVFVQSTGGGKLKEFDYQNKLDYGNSFYMFRLQ